MANDFLGKALSSAQGFLTRDAGGRIMGSMFFDSGWLETNVLKGRRLWAGFDVDRSGNPRVRKLAPTTVVTAGAATYTAAALLGGLILRDPTGASRSDVTPTAALIIAAMNEAGVEDSFEFNIINTADAAETITVTAGAGVTLVPATQAIAQDKTGKFLVRLTAADAITIYSLISA
jgi:hypothetical protein